MLREINYQKNIFSKPKIKQNFIQILRIEICESINLIIFFLNLGF